MSEPDHGISPTALGLALLALALALLVMALALLAIPGVLVWIGAAGTQCTRSR